MEVSVEMKGRTNKGFPNREQDMEYVQTSRSVRHEGLFDGKHVGIQGRGIGAASLYADSLFVFRRNRPVRTRTPGGAGPGLALRGQSGDPIGQACVGDSVPLDLPVKRKTFCMIDHLVAGDAVIVVTSDDWGLAPVVIGAYST